MLTVSILLFLFTSYFPSFSVFISVFLTILLIFFSLHGRCYRGIISFLKYVILFRAVFSILSYQTEIYLLDIFLRLAKTKDYFLKNYITAEIREQCGVIVFQPGENIFTNSSMSLARRKPQARAAGIKNAPTPNNFRKRGSGAFASKNNGFPGAR